MNKKIVSILVIMLLFATLTSVAGYMNNEEAHLIYKSRTTNNQPVWSDDFDDYSLNQFLDGGPDDGGWKGWDNNPTAGAYVVDNESLSSPHSVEIVDDTDLIHEFSGISSGNYTFKAWQFIPSDFSGITNLLLLNTYQDGGPHNNPHWSNAISFDSTTGEVKSWEGEILPIIFDEWVIIRIEIDFEADWQEIYYDEDLLVEKSWTAGVEPGGVLNLACVDLYAGDAPSTSVYYDDISLYGEPSFESDLFCEGSLSWVNQTPGDTLTGSFIVENVGGAGTQLDWEITDWPSWGDWTFEPASGTDLTPEDGQITIDVTVIAPDDKNEEFIGKVKIENSEDSEDFCYIDVSLTTPVSKPMFIIEIIEIIKERFPILSRILQF